MSKLFGRRKAIDLRDQNYPLRHMLALEPPPLHSLPWQAPACLDQGNTGVPGRDNEGSCTGHAGAHFLAAAPHLHPLTSAVALQLYDEARRNDEWPGEDYDGTSVRGLMKGLQALGLIRGGYLWAWDAATVRDYVQHWGPVIMGSDWYADMMQPDPHGYLQPTGTLEGGHAWCVLGYSNSRNAFRMQNSWGLGWGERGRAWVAFAALAWLLEHDGGEAVSAVEVVGP